MTLGVILSVLLSGVHFYAKIMERIHTSAEYMKLSLKCAKIMRLGLTALFVRM
jgi:hypothetical protein